MLEEKVSCSAFQRLLHDCCCLHADIDDKEAPVIHMKFGSYTNHENFQPVYSEFLSLEKDIHNGEEYKIKGVSFSNITSSNNEENRQELDSITALDLLNVAIPFAIADAICDTSFHGSHLAQNAKAFGASGKEQILEFSGKFLGPQKLIGTPAYRLGHPFYVNVRERKVTFGFECLIEKYLGEGTDYMYFNDELKIK